jgi:hypothetical protein
MKLHHPQKKERNLPDQHVLQKGWPQAAEIILSHGMDSKQIPQVSWP